MSIFDGKHFYNQTLKKCVSVFGTIFNNIKIVKTGSTEVRVPIAYGPRQKFLARINSTTTAASDNTIAIKLPRMSFEITSIDFDSSSKLNKMNKRVLNATSDSTTTSVDTVFQSVPYNISMQLNIYAKNQDDALQIVEQILPVFTPEYTVAVKDLEGPGTVTDVPIILQGTSFEDSYEGDFETRRTLTYVLDFAMKVKFAGGTSTGKVIRVVDTFFHTRLNHPTAKVNSTSIDGNTATIPIDGVNGTITTGMEVFGNGISTVTPTVTSITNEFASTGPTEVVLSSNQTLTNNTILTFREPTKDNNIRHAVASSDEPPLDETDTITTTFGFDHG